MFSLVRFGKYDQMLAFLRESSFSGNDGRLADTTIRHYKNLAIASVTLASRSATLGGVDYETAMSLGDVFNQNIERANDMKTLTLLIKSILRTYTRLVWERNQNYAGASLSTRAHRYIEQHLTEPIRSDAIAEHLQLSRSYLSSQFKRETGVNLRDFILQLKMDEAMRLLITTEESLASIASLLAFSSQNYFHTAFKKYAGLTPAEYRRHNRAGFPQP